MRKVCGVLRVISSNHNLRPPRFKDGGIVGDHDGTPKHSGNKPDEKMKIDWSDIDRLDQKDFIHDHSESEEEASGDDDISGDSGSFAAVGWGASDVDDDSA